ncbi:hypothetical protein [Luedemannella helvata]|uniref:HEPN domain-containing protein n=1 Tax=Luedemannella helvata TaxID=349315 RepID=A0ABN2KF82_9ACTN
MPIASALDLVNLNVSTLKKSQISALPTSGRNPFPLSIIVRQVVSDRLALAGEKLRAGDGLVRNLEFRSAISRHYYAMYHGARAIVFAVERGDDYERHNELPRHLPVTMNDVRAREVELTEARLLRNQADYDCYPVGQAGWEKDARELASIAATFLGACEDFALTNGYV